MRRPSTITLACLALGVGIGAFGYGIQRWRARMASPAPVPAVAAPHASDAADGGKGSERVAGRGLQLPTGTPAGLSCRDVRRVVAQARLHLACDPSKVDPRAIADATVEWLDPHGLWSASPDAPLSAFLRNHEREFLRELEASPDQGACSVAENAGALLAGWTATLSAAFDDAERRATNPGPAEAFALAFEPAFEDHGVARPARDLAQSLGHVAGTTSRAFGEPLERFVHAARERFLPPLSASAWSQVVLAAGLRGYLPQIDPHGAWAPLDEETSLSEVDLETDPPPRLWERVVRTALGVRVDDGGAPPLEPRDLVLEVAGIPTAGLSVEQVQQLAIFDGLDPRETRRVVVLREGERTVRTLDIPAPSEPEHGGEGNLLATEWVPYGDGSALVIAISDVPDDLGELLSGTLSQARAERTPTGVVLDLRGNGGGSTDGANDAIGVFLPGARLFPMKRRDGTIETERAPEPPESDRWDGPVAAIVDGDTASAAEMIAGALGAYRRGSIAGSRTYGKGCAQEYLEDEAHSGVLKLTTLIFALPDGSPVQRMGILPGIFLAGPRSLSEREAKVAHAPPSWRGPDVRDRPRTFEVAWPTHHGRVGPCKDDATCRTLRALGTLRATVARGRRAPP